MKATQSAEFLIPAQRTLALIVMHGRVLVNGSASAGEAQMVLFDRGGENISVEVEPGADAKFLVLSGEPLNEPVVGHGPFVMNSEKEIRQAIQDFNGGRFGHLPPASQNAAGG